MDEYVRACVRTVFIQLHTKKEDVERVKAKPK